MAQLYSILKTSKLGAGAAPDMYTALFAQKISKGGSGGEAELSGVPPLTFRSNGTPLIDYLISGNMIQSGTPTPDNPIMPEGCGERTGNLLSEKYENRSINGSGAFTVDNNYDLWVGEVVAGQIYTISNMNSVYGFFTAKPLPNTGVTYDGSRGIEISGTAVVTVPSGCTWIAVRVLHNADNAMLNLGSTALPYEPYGFEISISSASTTTPIYLGEVQTTRKIKKLVLTGEEDNWKKSTVYQGSFYNALLDTPAYTIPILCSHAVYIQQITPTTYVYGKCTVDGSASIKSLNLFIGEPSWSVSDFQQYLAAQYAAGTPVCVWYVLANPETGIVNEPLMEIGTYADTLSYAQAGVTIPTNNGSTTVDVGTTVKPSEVYIKYRT